MTEDTRLTAELLGRLHRVRRSGSGWTAQCPAHDDRENSLSVGLGDDNRILLKCHAGCLAEQILSRLELRWQELFPDRAEGIGDPSRSVRNPATPGCTLSEYARAKNIPEAFLRDLSVTEIRSQGSTALRIPYLDQSGAEVAVRYRHSLEGAARFRWKRGTPLRPYGLWRLDQARSAGYVVLVEGESDAHTLWLHGEPTLAVPGATSWRDEWAEYLADIPTVYAVVEPDRGGETLLARLGASPLRDRLRLVRLGDAKDPSALYLTDPERFRERWAAALTEAPSWTTAVTGQVTGRADERKARCAHLIAEPRILDRFAEALASGGVAGEIRAGKLLYLVMTSRLLDRPVSAVVKGPSGAGKSFLVRRVLEFFPPAAFYELSAMSEKALAYSREPLAHRVLVIYEAAGLRSEFASYLMRSLLSEGRVRYETVEKTSQGMRPRLIEREGPTGLLLTTTDVRLHPENETRMFSIPVTDTPEQTRAVLRQVARHGRGSPDFTPWRELQEWLSLQRERRVVVPFAEALADKIPPIAVRLRRDFPAILSLVRAHALLHQADRERDASGAIIATLDDYAVVLELVAELVAEGVQATVSASLRQTVEAVRALHESTRTEVTVAAVARALGVDKSTALRRVIAAMDRGYLRNLEPGRARTYRLVLGEPMPEDQSILPSPEGLAAGKGCRVAVETEGITTPRFSSGSLVSDTQTTGGQLVLSLRPAGIQPEYETEVVELS